jgi:hypothetical protein
MLVECERPIAASIRFAGSVLRKRVVRVTVEPPLSWFRRSDHRMSGGVSVFGGMFVRRAIAAQRFAALLTRTKVDPLAAHLDARFAHVQSRLFDRRDRTYVSTGASISHEVLCRL